MSRFLGSIACLALCLAAASHAYGQEPDNFTKNFKKFSEVATGIDMFAEGKTAVAAFAKPLADARTRLQTFLGDKLAPGAIVLCPSLEAKDSVNERRVLKLGYKWVLIQMTPEAQQQATIARIKAQMAQSGFQPPPGMLDRMQSPEAKAIGEAQLVTSTVRQMASAVVVSTLAPEKEFRASRLDDAGRSPLSDWLDIGLTSFAAGGSMSTLGILQQRLDEAFPLEDVLVMSRPFVAPTSGGGPGSAPVMVFRGPGSSGAAGPPAPGGAPGGAGPGAGAGGPGMLRNIQIPKDVQDRMLFDAQSAALFKYLIEKVGEGRVRELVAGNREGKPARDFLTRPELLGGDLDAAEKSWQQWIKAQKLDPAAGGMRMMMGPPPAAAPPKAPGD